MRKRIEKILLIVALFIGLQVSHAQSYQRWIDFGVSGHQVTPSEIGDITSALYLGSIEPKTWYRLSTGVVYKIDEPNQYLTYIEKCVRRSAPSATSAEKVVSEIIASDKRKWGTDVSLRVNNYWNKNGMVTYYKDYTGLGMPTDFLFINGIPTIKCDCGNPLEKVFNFEITPVSSSQPINKELSTDFLSKTKEESSSFVLPKNMSTLASMPVPYEQPVPISIPQKKFNWKPVIIIGGATLVVGTGFLLYSLLKKANGVVGGPIDAPPVGGDEGGPQDGQPVGP